MATRPLTGYHGLQPMVWNSRIGQRGLASAIVGLLAGTALALLGLGACKKEPPNVPHECSHACSEREYCVAKVVNDASVSPSLPLACKDAPDVCECVRQSKGPPHYHCAASDAGVILVAP
jgi:hypothetical protein